MNKRVFSISLIILIAALLLTGCAEDIKTSKKTAKKTASSADYTGFMDLKAGQWTETVSRAAGEKITTRIEVLEQSPSLNKFQITTGPADEKIIAQVWIHPINKIATKYVVKAGGDVTCYDMEDVPDGYVPAEQGSYDIDRVKPTYDIYTTPTDKEVSVAKFKTSKGEIWLSSEVPFGLVKMMTDGDTISSLYDFGSIGAKSMISAQEIDDCRDLSGVMDTLADYTSDDDEEEADDEYEEYYETEPETVKTSINTQDKADDDVTFDCGDCSGMPPAAKSACLAACN
ncbi:hypothetical protein ACFL3V_06630 [Nanoarchaeota archaeon]